MGILHAFEYQELLARLPQVEMSDGCPLLDQVMLIKEKQEIALLRQAAAIADAGFLAAREALRPGVSENHVAGVAEAAMRDLGNEFNWSQSGGTEVGSGHRTAYLGGVTQPATQKIIQDGDNIILDLHPMYRLYMADACYNLVVGKAGAEQRRLAGVWEKAVETLLAQSCPGWPSPPRPRPLIRSSRRPDWASMGCAPLATAWEWTLGSPLPSGRATTPFFKKTWSSPQAPTSTSLGWVACAWNCRR